MANDPGNPVPRTPSFCSNCANPLPPAAAFCDHCGATVINTAASAVIDQRRSSRNMVVLAIAGALVVGAAVAAFLLARGGDDDNGGIVRSSSGATQAGPTPTATFDFAKGPGQTIAALTAASRDPAREAAAKKLFDDLTAAGSPPGLPASIPPMVVKGGSAWSGFRGTVRIVTPDAGSSSTQQWGIELSVDLAAQTTQGRSASGWKDLQPVAATGLPSGAVCDVGTATFANWSSVECHVLAEPRVLVSTWIIVPQRRPSAAEEQAARDMALAAVAQVKKFASAGTR